MDIQFYFGVNWKQRFLVTENRGLNALSFRQEQPSNRYACIIAKSIDFQEKME